MQEIFGKYANAKVFTEKVEECALQQIQELCDQPFAKGSQIRIMPDVHAGVGCTIGTTMTIQDAIVPNMVGVDIGCGMETIRFRCKRLELAQLDRVIRDRIPSAMNVRQKVHEFAAELDLSALRCAKQMNLERAARSVGTLGGGNHFIEVDQDDEGNRYLVIHSGSRHLGAEVAKHYQSKGYDALKEGDDIALQSIIAAYKAQGREAEIQAAIQAAKAQKRTPIRHALAYVQGTLREDYLHDMKIVQHFAVLNRRAMAHEIVRGMKLDVEEQFTTIHNYIDTENMILRKGAVSAQAGEKLLIPINMRDGSLICIGKGNEDWNFSAPHGAGRLFSRTAAKSNFTVSQFKKEMKGIFSTSIGANTLDESPMAYKSMEEILSNIGPTVDIDRIIRPIYNFKAEDSKV